ncbi:prepilin-type N-terminal cleavage/methylation domain-containing protein [Heliorestis acidaminivorans]|uniref:Prepilin-type N-terminal cleavage/methylation domain-containing protein n=1 Tax=Heliorestis acidaminivorans TaxID=553427 RepID=A0A6I0EZ18_9FIRM|nr:type II secretion system protein [Heliorestis acidaminivorans]KAB2952642.1 prepilin-type N-terminal cleavage/methylation domain-containing protein [Heliorestis acidaminivorans]
MTISKIIKNHKAFSLIEILIVMTIVGILLSLGLPTMYNSLAEYKLNMAARQVQADMHWAREQAVKERNNFTIYFPTGLKQYTVNRSGYDLQYRRELPAGVRIHATSFYYDKDRAYFSVDGRVINPTMGGTVMLENERGHLRYIILSRNGRVRISKEAPGAGE